jgi:hypothetical protein
MALDRDRLCIKKYCDSSYTAEFCGFDLFSPASDGFLLWHVAYNEIYRFPSVRGNRGRRVSKTTVSVTRMSRGTAANEEY